MTNIYRQGFILLLLIMQSGKAISQSAATVTDSIKFLNKTNSVQIADYKPKKAKRGKNGDERITPIFFKSGRHGNEGKNGQQGPDLVIHISQANLFGQYNILVSVRSTDNTVNDSFYINPLKGQLKIIADGADGGDGGQGENESSSNSSAGGGNGGNGGNGGSLDITYNKFDNFDKDINHWLILSNSGGLGGRGGTGGKSKDFQYSSASDGSNGKPGYLGSQNFHENKKE